MCKNNEIEHNKNNPVHYCTIKINIYLRISLTKEIMMSHWPSELKTCRCPYEDILIYITCFQASGTLYFYFSDSIQAQNSTKPTVNNCFGILK